MLSVGMAGQNPKAALSMSREYKQYAIGSEAEPVVRVKPGDILVIETEDCFDNQIKCLGMLLTRSILTGKSCHWPHLYRRGRAGDTLAVDI